MNSKLMKDYGEKQNNYMVNSSLSGPAPIRKRGQSSGSYVPAKKRNSEMQSFDLGKNIKLG